MDDEIDEIVRIAKDIIDSQKPYLEYLEEEFEFIKYRNITRERQIEQLLDNVLSLLPTNGTLDLYIRICKYYHAINKEASRDYARFYAEIYEDDTVVNEINKLDERIKKYGRIL